MEIKSKIDKQISISSSLLDKGTISSKDIQSYKNSSKLLFDEILNLNIDSHLTDQAKQGLCFDVKKIQNTALRKLINFFSEARNNITYDAPYLKKETDSDYYKTYIFWTRMRLEGIYRYMEKTTTT